MADFFLHSEKIGTEFYLAPLSAPPIVSPPPAPTAAPVLAVYAPMSATGINLYSRLL